MANSNGNLDLSQLSDDDLQNLYNIHTSGNRPIPNTPVQPSPNEASQDLSHYSDEDLQNIYDAHTNPPGAMTAGIHGFLKTSTLGYAPEIRSKLTGENLDVLRQQENELNQNHPYAYKAGEAAGALALPFVGEEAAGAGGAIEGGGLLANILKAGGTALGGGEITGIGSGLAKGALSGALYGGLQNPETQPNQNLTTEQNLRDRMANALGGGLIGGPLGAIGGRLAQSSEASAEQAGKMAFEALKPSKAAARMAGDNAPNIGNTLINEGIITGAPKDFGTISDEISEALDAKGKQLGDYINDLANKTKKSSENFGETLPALPGDTSVSGTPSSVGLDTEKIANSAREELSHLNLIPGGQSKVNKINNILNDFVDKNDPHISIQDAQDLKEALGKEIVWKRPYTEAIPPSEAAYRSLYGKIQQGLEDAGEAMSSLHGDDEYQKYINLKQDYGNLKAAAKMSENAENSATANRHFSLTDYLAAGAVHSNPAFAAAAMGGNKIMRTYGSQIGAGALNLQSGVSKSMENTLPGLMKFLQEQGIKSGNYGSLGGGLIGGKYSQ